MKDFGARLQLAMDLREKRPVDVANNCNISRGAMSMYLSGKRQPKADIIATISNYLDISPLYLMGITDNVFSNKAIKPSNSLTQEINVKQALIEEINVLISWCDEDELRKILDIIKVVKK